MVDAWSVVDVIADVRDNGQLWADLVPVLPDLGITRVGDVTGLDRVGVPVAVACRPLSRALSVSQGKGTTLAEAKVSAVMESAEGAYAERHRVARRHGSYEELKAVLPVIGPDRLGTSHGYTDPNAVIAWTRAADLRSGDEVWLPYELVHTDYRVTWPAAGSMYRSSDGLGAHVSRRAAIAHAICELVERTAVACWQRTGRKHETAVDPASVTDPDCRWILDRLAAAGVIVGLWDATGPAGLATFVAMIVDRDPSSLVVSARGSGAHLDPARALRRALLEAIQSRLTVIVGVREDVVRPEYAAIRDQRRTAAFRAALSNLRPERSFHDVTAVRDVVVLTERLEYDRIAVVDLSPDDAAIRVVRVVIPGLDTRQVGR